MRVERRAIQVDSGGIVVLVAVGEQLVETLEERMQAVGGERRGDTYGCGFEEAVVDHVVGSGSD